MISGDRQVEYRGLLLTEAGPIHVQTMTGLGLPEMRTADVPLLGRHGERAGTDLAAGRTIGLELEVVTYDAPSFAAAMDALRSAMAPGGVEAPLSFRIPGVAGGEAARAMVRPRRMAMDVGVSWWDTSAPVSVEFYATDPLLYSEAEQTASTRMATAASTGLTFPLTYGRTYGTLLSDGKVSAYNAGTVDAPWLLTIVGPALNPVFEDFGSSRSLTFVMELAAGEYLEVDSQARTVMLNGTANRYATLTTDSQWFDLAPGINYLGFGSATPTDSTMTITWRHAWL